MAFPLSTVKADQLQTLGKIIWGWQLCGACDGKPECTTATCSWSRTRRLSAFWDWYKHLTKAYVQDLSVTLPALSSHEDLLEIIRKTREQPDLERGDLIQKCFPPKGKGTPNSASSSDQDRALNIAAGILFLTNCGTSNECADFLEVGGFPIPWQDSMTARSFVSDAYPIKAHSCFNRKSDEYKAEEILQSVTAPRLIEAGFELQSTNDLRSHLTVEYKKRKRVIRVFHGSAVLKEMLLASSSDEDACIMPRLIALEVLHTIQQVLFPPTEDAQRLLAALVKKRQFDQDLLHYDMSRYQRDDDPDVTYSYFGGRLVDVYEELQNPTPRSRLERWFQKYSSQRYMLMATMIGVFIAVILGFLGLAVAGFQAWLTYQQWKHPVRNE